MNTIMLIAGKSAETGSTAGYMAGTIIALFIFAYLIYSLIKPEKF
jgi:K+-transporting ATPase KdpF subunit